MLLDADIEILIEHEKNELVKVNVELYSASSWMHL